MEKRFKFTTSALNSIPANPKDSPSTELEFSDTEVVGLKCLSGKTGSKRFLLRYQYNGRKGSLAIGRYPDIDLVTARKIARQHKTAIAMGQDPKTTREKAHAVPTVGEFFHQKYLPLAKKRKSSWRSDLQRFTDHCKPIAQVRYSELTATQVLKLQMDMSTDRPNRPAYKAATCNRVLAILKTMGKLAMKTLDIPNVAERVSLLPENNARTRYCDLDETKRIIKAARAYHCKYTGSFIALLFITGCRFNELRERKWSDLDLGRRTLMIPRTKNGSYHIIYLSDLMTEIFTEIPQIPGNPYIFCGRIDGQPLKDARNAFTHIKQVAQIPNPEEVLFHTARHSVASNLISNGADITSVQKLLNHRSIESTLRYAKLSESKQRETSESLSKMIFDR